MHYALTSGMYDPANVRADLPQCAALYDGFMQQVERTTRKRRGTPIYEPMRLPSSAKSPVRSADPKQAFIDGFAGGFERGFAGTLAAKVAHNAAMPEFLRGDELILDSNDKLVWGLGESSDVSLRSSPYFTSMSSFYSQLENGNIAAITKTMHKKRATIEHWTKANAKELEGTSILIERFPGMWSPESNATMSFQSAVAHFRSQAIQAHKIASNPRKYGANSQRHAQTMTHGSVMTDLMALQQDIDPSHPDSVVLPKPEYDAAVRSLKANPAFALVAPFLKKHGLPVNILRKLPKGNEMYFTTGSGMLVTPDFIEQLGSNDKHVALNAQNLLISNLAIYVLAHNARSLEKFGLNDNKDYEEVVRQYSLLFAENHGSPIENGTVPQVLYEACKDRGAGGIVFDYLQAMGDPEKACLLEKYPQLSQFCASVVQAIEPSILIADTVTKAPALDEPPIVTLSDWRFTPKLFTNNPREQQLIESVRPFIGEALRNEPPCEQFRCHLVLSDRNGQDNFPIRLTFRNKDGVTKEFTVHTGTRDLDEAIALKKAIQSHVLNHPSIVPLRLRYRDESPEKPVTQTDAIMPRYEPSSVELVDYGRHYAARFHFTGASGSNQQVVIPLGLRYEPHRPLMAAEADRRLAYLQRHVAETREKGYWETLGEVVQDLKRAVMERRPAGDKGLLNGNGFGWRVAETMPLEHFGDCVDADGNAKPYSLGFPATGPQATVLKSAILRMEEGTKTPNPSWRLHLTVGVSGLGDGKETHDYHTSINLHTADATTAQTRGGEAVQSLEEDLKLRADIHPDMRWHTEGDKSAELFLQHGDGSRDRDPEPQTLFHLFEDMPNPKQSFQIVPDVKPSARDGYLTVSLGVQRGTKAENDLIDFSDLNGKPVRRSFDVPAGDEAKIDALVQTINETFKSYLNDAYGNRTINQNNERIRKTRQEYRTATIRNLFDKAVVSHLGEGTSNASHADATQIRETHVARR